MVTLNEPQVWTLIGVFSAAMFGLIGVVSTMFIQVLRAEIGKISVQIDVLDRDVQAVARRVFPDRD